ncbi:MAG: AAA family ATPase [Thermofilaceae archaeon]|nr:AAA family ATPase [Thermofilaceae archaeon]MCX8181264.1 AAA family ATPase [Thermofilaceae archaeon]MDW8003517.1 AAA family ATPase [Thermofilaceae archaeon]
MSTQPVSECNLYAREDLLRRVLAKLVGREKEVRAVLAALASARNIVLVGAPGTSKSTILRTIAEESSVPFFIVEGSADLTPQKLVGTFNPAKVMGEGFKPEYFEPGPLVQAMDAGGLLYIEEFNRMPEETANALIRAAEERELAVPRLGVLKAKPSFRIVCAMNPYDDVGTGRVSRALLDRFVMLKVGYQSRAEEIKIVELRTGSRRRWLIELAVDLVRATRLHPAVKMGSSVRGAIDMVLLAEQLIRARETIDVDELKMAALMALTPKIWMKDPSRSPEEVIEEIFFSLIERGRPPFSEAVGQDREHDPRNTSDGSGGDAERLRSLAEVAPRRAALLVVNNPSLLDGMASSALTGLDVIARIYLLLPSPYRDKLRTFARDLTVRAALGYAGRRWLSKGRGEPLDIDVDATVERVSEVGKTIEALSFFTVRKKGRAYALIIDRSSSMSGFKLVLGAFICSALAYSSSLVDDYCVLSFNTRVDRLKGLRERLDVEEVVDRILSLEAEGYTDIFTALMAGRRELIEAGYEPRAILVTDAEWTAGRNPLEAAPLFNELHVILVPSKYLGFAKVLAEMGSGKLVFVRSIQEAYEKLPTLIES